MMFKSNAERTPRIPLKNGTLIPAIGLSTWKTSNSDVVDAVRTAIDAGYRHIDCAQFDDNEKGIGEALAEAISSNKVTREELFITTKLWNTCHKDSLVRPALKQSLSDLKLEQVDLYLMQWPFGFLEGPDMNPVDDTGKVMFSDVDYVETWKSMEKLVELGLTKSIGLANFNSVQISRILEIATIPPVINQIECHPYLNQEKLIRFCRANDMVVAAYSPLGSPDRPWAREDEPVLLEDMKLAGVAHDYNKSPAQVLIRYQLQRGTVVIPKAAIDQHIKDNINVFDFELGIDDMRYLNSLHRNCRYFHMDWVNDHPLYPFNVEF